MSIVNYEQFKKMLGQVEEMERIFLVVDIDEEAEIRIVGEDSKRRKNCLVDTIPCYPPRIAMINEELAIKRQIIVNTINNLISEISQQGNL